MILMALAGRYLTVEQPPGSTRTVGRDRAAGAAYPANGAHKARSVLAMGAEAFATYNTDDVVLRGHADYLVWVFTPST
jgi:hypothetical protein